MKHSRAPTVAELSAALGRLEAPVEPERLLELATWIAVAGRAAGLTHYDTPEMALARGMSPAADAIRIISRAGPGAIAEIGPGSGAVGLTIAMALPSRAIRLIDRREKCCAFLDVGIRRLGLSNAQTTVAELPVRSPELLGGPFAVVIARAFASPAELLAATASIAAAGGHLCWLTREDNVPRGASSDFTVVDTRETPVPGLWAVDVVVGRGLS